MSIPDYQTVMLPLLRLAADGQEHKLRDVTETLAETFGLTDEEKRAHIASGPQGLFYNRVAWARTYLGKALLVESAGHGLFRITERGTQALAGNPAKINVAFLARYPEFQEWKQRGSQQPEKDSADVADTESRTPEEQMEAGYQLLRVSLADELLQKILGSPPDFLERLVVDLLVAMGYGGSRRDAGMAVGQSGDGGIDGVIKEDKLGLEAVYVQAKRWEGTVGRPAIQSFAGSLEGQRARKGVFITTSSFSKEARDYVSRIEKKIVLIDGPQLAGLMIDHGIGVSEVANYSVKRIDADYFGDEAL